MFKQSTFLNNLKACSLREIDNWRINGRHVIAFFTYRCTNHCQTCNIWKRDDHKTNIELNYDQWKHIILDLKKYKIESFEIFGGDALLRKDLIYQVIQLCKISHIKTYFPTNANLLDEDTAFQLAKSGLDTIYLSIDGLDLNQDKIRGTKGSFQSIINAIEYLSKAKKSFPNLKIIACCTISSFNWNHFEDMVYFLNQYPIDAINPRVIQEFKKENLALSEIEGIQPEPFFMPSNQKSHLMTHEQHQLFKNAIQKIKKNKNNLKIQFHSKLIDSAEDTLFTTGTRQYPKCQYCSTVITIDPYGNVLPCLYYNHYHLGNLNSESITQIWGNQFHHQFIKHQQKQHIKICENCNIVDTYTGLKSFFKYYFAKFKIYANSIF